MRLWPTAFLHVDVGFRNCANHCNTVFAVWYTIMTMSEVVVRARTGQQTGQQTGQHGEHTERKSERRLGWLGHVMRIDHQRTPQQALYCEVPGHRRGPGRPRTNWRNTVNKVLDKRRGSAGRKQRWQLLTDTDGVGCGPMCPRGCGMNQGHGQGHTIMLIK